MELITLIITLLNRWYMFDGHVIYALLL